MTTHAPWTPQLNPDQRLDHPPPAAAPSSATRPRHRRRGAGVAASDRRPRSPPRPARQARPLDRRASTRCTSRRGPSGSSSCTWPAGRRTWRRSTTSPSWPRWTASRCPSRSPRASRSRSSRGRSSTASGRSTRSRSSASAGRRSASCSRSIGSVADDICIIRSMRTEAINHDPAHTFMNTGTTISGRPSMGSWVTYGLGSDVRRPARLRRADQPRARGGQNQPIAVAAVAQRASCPAGSRACSSAGRATRCSTSAAPPASSPGSSGTWSTRCSS